MNRLNIDSTSERVLQHMAHELAVIDVVDGASQPAAAVKSIFRLLFGQIMPPLDHHRHHAQVPSKRADIRCTVKRGGFDRILEENIIISAFRFENSNFLFSKQVRVF